MNLQFITNRNKNIPYTVNPTIVHSRNMQMGNLSNNKMQMGNLSNNRIQIVKREVPKPIVQSDEPKKMKWGEPTWLLLHTLCEKIKDENFYAFRQSLISIIYLICTNLPCPDCSTHAKIYLDNINMNMVQTKTQLKRMMFDFHNTLNIKKGFKLLNYNDLDQKYSAAITMNIIYNFMNFYSVKNRSIHMISNDIYRENVIKNIKEWFNNNIQYFNP
jgi:hypothetical protein